jgi:hypothetical protein
MANQNKVVIPGKVQKDSKLRKKFRINKHKDNEVDIDIEIDEDGNYEVDKLSIDGLPATMHDGHPIIWFNNFAVKKNGQYIKQKYKITIPGISSMGKAKLVIFDGNGDPYYYTGTIVNDTFEMTDGDPAFGRAP